MATVFKVVRKTFYGGYFSFMKGALEELAVEYKIGEVATPKLAGSKLFVFGTLDSAKRWISADGNERYSILECEADNPIPMESRCESCFPGYVKEFWAGIRGVSSRWDYAYCPSHTHGVDSLKPIRVVD